MRKSIIIAVMIALTALPVLAATTDFVASDDVTVSGVTFGSGTASLLIMNGSKCESFTYNSGTFTVTNPDATSGFSVGSADTTVKSIRVNNSSESTVACEENTIAGTSYVSVPVTTGTYTVSPSTSTDCQTLCSTLTGVSTYNDFPTCGASTCLAGYNKVGTGASATCAPYSASPPGGGGSTQTTAPTTQNQTTQTETVTPAPTATETPVKSAAPTVKSGTVDVAQILSDAKAVIGSAKNVTEILDNSSQKNDSSLTKAVMTKYTEALVKNEKTLSADSKTAINNFVAYGTKSTLILGAGERAGVVSSFKSAFGKVPVNEADWQDVVKIANGRWPAQKDAQSEKNAETAFKKIYKRSSVRTNSHDDAAVTVMAYGLRPANRNLKSEAAAIKSFKAIYGYAPKSAAAWDIVRAIAYSGAKR